MAIKIYDGESLDFLEAEPLGDFVQVKTGSEGEGYGVSVSYESITTFRDYLTSILEGRETNDQML